VKDLKTNSEELGSVKALLSIHPQIVDACERAFLQAIQQENNNNDDEEPCKNGKGE
jgi:hypothetical protein